MYSNEFEYEMETAMEELMSSMELGFGRSMLSTIFSIVGYVFLALGLYTLAKRRGIRNPWLAWIPLAQLWVLGSVSDQYQYLVNGRVKSKRKALLALGIVSSILAIVIIIFAGMLLVNVFEQAMLDPDFMLEENPNMNVAGMIAPGMGILGAALILIGVAIAEIILEWMALYDLFASCQPASKVPFLIFGILFSWVMGIFVFICRNKDNGMPLRRDAFMQQPNPYQPNPYQPVQQPWQAPVQQPVWQPKQPPAEPWENSNPEE